MNGYKHENVEYKFSRVSRKWEFLFGDQTLLVACPGGKQTADLISKQIAASCKRRKKNILDNVARKKIDTLCKV